VIVRIATEGQYELDDGDAAELNKLDNETVAPCEAGDEQSFRAAFGRLLEYVRANGQPVAEDHLGGSDLILPPPDVSLEEAKVAFRSDGLIPD